MSLLTFQCPMCDGVFRAEESVPEVSCPHCRETIELSHEDKQKSDGGSEQSPRKKTQVQVTVTRTKQSAPILPPGFKKPPAAAPLQDDTDTEAVLQPPVIASTESNGKDAQIPAAKAQEESLNEGRPDPQDMHNVQEDIQDVQEESESTVEHPGAMQEPAVTEPLPETSESDVGANDLPDVQEEEHVEVREDGEANQESSADLTSILAELDLEEDEALSETNLLPPSLNGASALPEQRVALPAPEIDTGEVEPEQAVESLSVEIKLRHQPQTVGYGSNKMELVSRTSDEKQQFKRNKNVIVWVIGAMLIVLTMLIMLNL